MNEHNQEIRKCKICGKTIVGKNTTGICTACKKSIGDHSVKALGIFSLVGGGIWTAVKAFTKKD